MWCNGSEASKRERRPEREKNTSVVMENGEICLSDLTDTQS